jgi:uncharacterized protein (TIGR00369 family)
MTRPQHGKTLFGFEIPFLELLGARLERWEKGHAVVALDVRRELTNSWQFVHGGVVMTLLDVALAGAALTPESPGGLVTVQLTVSFLRSGSGALRAEGRLVHGGRSLVFCEGEVRDASGEIVAKGMGSFKVKRRGEAEDRG